LAWVAGVELVGILLDELGTDVDVGFEKELHVLPQGELVGLAALGQVSDHGVVPPGSFGGEDAVLEWIHTEAHVPLEVALENDDPVDDVRVSAVTGHIIDVVVVLLNFKAQDLPRAEGVPVDVSRHGLHRESHSVHRGGDRLVIDGDDSTPEVERGLRGIHLGLGGHDGLRGIQGLGCCGRAPESGYS